MPFAVSATTFNGSRSVEGEKGPYMGGVVLDQVRLFDRGLRFTKIVTRRQSRFGFASLRRRDRYRGRQDVLRTGRT